MRISFFFFFNDTATTEIYTLSLHDALPIHPIGLAHRKGRNNALVAAPGDPGSPWAIGSADGGYMAVHPDLGTLDDFDRFVATAGRLGLEIALDLAIQCSPDHPWVREHREWFFHRP